MMLFFILCMNWGWNESFYRGMVLLTVASLCASCSLLAHATSLSAIFKTAHVKGILFKSGSYLENIGQIRAIIF